MFDERRAVLLGRTNVRSFASSFSLEARSLTYSCGEGGIHSAGDPLIVGPVNAVAPKYTTHNQSY